MQVALFRSFYLYIELNPQEIERDSIWPALETCIRHKHFNHSAFAHLGLPRDDLSSSPNGQARPCSNICHRLLVMPRSRSLCIIYFASLVLKMLRSPRDLEVSGNYRVGQGDQEHCSL